MKVCHLSSVHPANDTRIFYRECKSLAQAGYDVTLIANHDGKEASIAGVNIISFPAYRNRFLRMFLAPLRMFFLARRQKAALYHLHDPELVITGLLLKCTGLKVIFDVHENIVRHIEEKDFLLFAALLSRLFIPFNYLAARFLPLVLAENSYENLYKKYSRMYKVVLNMPDIKFFDFFCREDRRANDDVFYIGRVEKIRGAGVALQALHILKKRKIRLNIHFVGYLEDSLKKELENLDYFHEIEENVIFYGRKNLEEGYEISKQCLVGISVLKPLENHLYSYSTKIFEYMAVSLPVITSNFELYKDVVERNDCGFCIDPTDPGALADSIAYLFTHKDRAMEMGKNGRAAVIEKFNWAGEEKKMLDFYRQVLSG